MTAAELIEKLRRVPPDAVVTGNDGDDEWLRDVEAIHRSTGVLDDGTEQEVVVLVFARDTGGQEIEGTETEL